MCNKTDSKRPTRVLIADGDGNAVSFLVRELFKAGYEPVKAEAGGAAAVHAARVLKPDIVILEAVLPDVCGVEAAAVLHDEFIAPVVLIAAEVTPEIVRHAAQAMVFSIMMKPIQIARLIPSIEIAIGQWQELLRQTGRVSEMREKEETRDIVLLAKRVLIETRGMNETTAYRTMRNLSMNTRRPMKAVAEEVLQAADAQWKKDSLNLSADFVVDEVA